MTLAVININTIGFILSSHNFQANKLRTDFLNWQQENDFSCFGQGEMCTLGVV